MGAIEFATTSHSRSNGRIRCCIVGKRRVRDTLVILFVSIDSLKERHRRNRLERARRIVAFHELHFDELATQVDPLESHNGADDIR